MSQASHRRPPQLSKTRFGAGLQCLKRLYLECYSRDLADPISASQQTLFDSGLAIGELARQRFPADNSAPGLYEAAFTFDGIRIRTDILTRNTRDSFDLVEVKSSTSVKREHIPDVAIQLHVLKRDQAFQ